VPTGSWAAAAQRPVPELSERIYSIPFEHDGETWEATVGQTLCGNERSSKNYPALPGVRLSDPATVLAIFPGYPYVVVTDGGFSEGQQSMWANPFFASRPSIIVRFSKD